MKVWIILALAIAAVVAAPTDSECANQASDYFLSLGYSYQIAYEQSIGKFTFTITARKAWTNYVACMNTAFYSQDNAAVIETPTTIDSTGSRNVYYYHEFTFDKMVNTYKCTNTSYSAEIGRFSCNLVLSLALKLNPTSPVVILKFKFDVMVNTKISRTMVLNVSPFVQDLGKQTTFVEIASNLMWCSDSSCAASKTVTGLTYNDLLYFKLYLTDASFVNSYKVMYTPWTLKCSTVSLPIKVITLIENKGSLIVSFRAINTGTCTIEVNSKLIYTTLIQRELQTDQSDSFIKKESESFTITCPAGQTCNAESDFVKPASGFLMQVSLALMALIFLFIF
jgi:hypothetical protein